MGNTVYDDIKDTQSKVNKDIEKLEEMKRALAFYEENIETFEYYSKDESSELEIRLSGGFRNGSCIRVPSCVKKSIVQFVLENKEQIRKEYVKQIKDKEREILKIFKG